MKNDDSVSTYIQYTIFNSLNSEQLILKYWLDTKISITVPVNLVNETTNLSNSLIESG